MTTKAFIDKALQSDIMKQWHWFQFHFDFYNRGKQHPFAQNIIDACVELEAKIPKVGVGYLNRIASISGMEKYLTHYEQLFQVLAELLILHKALTYPQWPIPYHYEYEPTTKVSKVNPEVIIQAKDFSLGIEVKAPSLLQHQRNRETNPFQVPARSDILDNLERTEVTLPRDNSIKDFMISANKKFANFKLERANFCSVLVIVWDDFVYEPLSSFLSVSSGLFTENSFAKDSAGQVLTFPNVDAVIIVPQLNQFNLAAAGKPLADGFSGALDYGPKNSFPFKSILFNPFKQCTWPAQVHYLVQDCFDAHFPDAQQMGAEYGASDLIIWSKN